MTTRLALLLGLCVGCATAYSANQSRAMYAAEFACPTDDVRAQNVGGASAVLVKGCGFQQMYACANGACVANGPRRPVEH